MLGKRSEGYYFFFQMKHVEFEKYFISAIKIKMEN